MKFWADEEVTKLEDEVANLKAEISKKAEEIKNLNYYLTESTKIMDEQEKKIEILEWQIKLMKEVLENEMLFHPVLERVRKIKKSGTLNDETYQGN